MSEITNLTVDDVDFVTGKVHIYSIKTKKHRTGFLDAKALKHLIDYRSELAQRGIYSDALFKWLERQRRQDDDIKSLKKEMTLVCYCMSCVLDGLLKQGCNHTVPAAKEKLDKYLNQKAYDQFDE